MFLLGFLVDADGLATWLALKPLVSLLSKVAPENRNPDVGAGIGLIQLRKVWHVSLIRALRQGFHKLMHSSLVIVTLGQGPFFSESADASVRLGLLHASFLLHHPSDRRVLLKKRVSLKDMSPQPVGPVGIGGH